MMIKKLLTLSIIYILASGCGKKGNDPAPDKNTVKISGRDYKTVTIGTQVWTAENYAGPGGYSDPAKPTFGSYFTLSQAQAISLPAGWRLPTFADFSKLTSNVTTNTDADGYSFTFLNGESRALLSTSGWPNPDKQGTNKLGFNAMNTGFYIVRPAQVLFVPQNISLYVTATAIPLTNTQHALYGYQLDPDIAGLERISDPEAQSFSVRFVKDL